MIKIKYEFLATETLHEQLRAEHIVHQPGFSLFLIDKMFLPLSQKFILAG
jgi:hypothetical protein